MKIFVVMMRGYGKKIPPPKPSLMRHSELFTYSIMNNMYLLSRKSILRTYFISRETTNS